MTPGWTFLTDHAHLLLAVADLESTGYLHRNRTCRRTTYLDLAAGASIFVVAVVAFFAIFAAQALRNAVRDRPGETLVVA